MPEVTAPYTAGTPCWATLSVPDQQAALDFYRDLFGWSGRVGPPETGGYAVCVWQDRAVAGIARAQPMGDLPAPPTAWTTFLCADDADAAAAAVTGNGGRLLTPVDDVPGRTGRMFVAADPAGAAFGVWQPLDFFGAEIVNEPGAMAWNELNSRDLDASAAFYRRALGVGVTPFKDLPGYFTLEVDGRAVGGMRALDDTFPPGTPSNWLTYFAVDDVDSTVDAAVRAGASVLAPPFDMVAGRMSVVADPQGGVFAVLAQPPES
ncbi:VOC family protein [Streptantibioticus silvisoli]|uniref:VOC family protein n=1 Tax=Streptantibioticus silvisoli TaxID=2705255 RepID=A0ABT6VVX2_9ACTN|nr:VOC family protein [Streptantibioticus silvisoli]MDI5962636.1 VOC family protein [Streptantibioticus silvisoli]